jgi:protein-disulfide isomerase
MTRALFVILLSLFIGVTGSYAQTAAKAVATAKGVTITANDLSPEAKGALENLPNAVAASRTQALSTYLADRLLEMEAKARKIGVIELQSEALKAVPDPSAETIQAVYDGNKAALGNRPLTEVRDQIVAFLRQEPEQKALNAQVVELQKKHGMKFGKDVNAADLKPLDPIATIGNVAVTAKEFEEKNKIALYDAKAHLYDDLRVEIEDALLNALILEEAKAQNVAANVIIQTEITNKARDFSDEERLDLEDALRRKLFAKYGAKVLLDEPAPLVLNVSADDDPSIGPATAPVTIVMFSDFQCPACGRTHPVLKRVLAEYGDKVRLVVRDFPLEGIHPQAFQAAAAANAARQQGKYFEYIDILYRNQEELENESLMKYATGLGIDIKKMTADMSAAAVAPEIKKDIEDGISYGVGGTPTIFVNGVKVHRLSAPAFRRAIERALVK